MQEFFNIFSILKINEVQLYFLKITLKCYRNYLLEFINILIPWNILLEKKVQETCMNSLLQNNCIFMRKVKYTYNEQSFFTYCFICFHKLIRNKYVIINTSYLETVILLHQVDNINIKPAKIRLDRLNFWYYVKINVL